MPVRIYDISKKLGLENKDVLSKAKELGIAAARVASSSLDKITAEYLEEKLRLAFPNATAPPAPSAPAPAPPRPQEPIMIVSAPPPAAPPKPEIFTGQSAPPAEPSLTSEGAALSTPVEPPSPISPPRQPLEPEAPEEPAQPAGPKVGDQVGFIQLPTKPASEPADKPPPVKLPARPRHNRG